MKKERYTYGQIIVDNDIRCMKGACDSIHAFEVEEKRHNTQYKLISIGMLYMITNNQKLSQLNLSGDMMR